MTLETLVELAESAGIRVIWERGARRQGMWFETCRVMIVQDGMTTRRTRSTLAHELGHAHYGDRCSNPKAERRAWEYAARLLINPERFDEVVELHGPHAGAIARHLDVLVDVVRAYWRIHPRRKP